jgi:adenylate cyclase
LNEVLEVMMRKNVKPQPISIDLNQFKLHIDVKNEIQLTLHFDSPSRKFYLSIIAFLVNEMKKAGNIASIPLEHHIDLLRLLNETIGAGAGLSGKEHILPRIYRKWKDALPNLEAAPLFRVLGRRKEYDEGVVKAYPFTKTEKDSWANLFEYRGSEENVRLRFALDKIGVALDDVDIIYEDSVNGDAWDRFLLSLKGKAEKTPEIKSVQPLMDVPESPVSLAREKGTSLLSGHRRLALIAILVVIVGAATLVIWKLSSKPAPVRKASFERMAFPLPDIPSIAVLPFVNMSKDHDQDFFSDGLTEEIITALSKSPNLFVIARSSTFKYKGKSVEARQLSEDLGVQYVLEGSVRRSEGKVRITAQLIDAINGYYLWGEEYDREIKEVLTIQDEIAFKIMKALHVKLHVGQFGSETGKGAMNLEIYLKALEGREQVLRYTKDGNVRARRLFEEALTLDPNYARGYSGLAISYAADVWLGASKNPKDSLSQAVKFAEKAVSLDQSDATAQAVLAYLCAMTRQYDEAVSRAERALALDPNSYSVFNNCGIALAYSGKYEEALGLLERAARLNPSTSQSFVMLSMAYRIVGRYEDSFQHAKKAVELNPKSQLAQIALAATSALTGRYEDAHTAAASVLKINPEFSVERYGRTLPFRDTPQVALMTDSLRKAGLK